MKVYKFSEKLNIPENSVLCLGNFDGVHLRHRPLFDEAKKHGAWGVMVFEENFKNEKVLTTFAEKLEIIKNLGADYVISVKPTKAFLETDGEEFYRNLVEEYGIAGFVTGYDYRFGKGAKYSSEDLSDWCRRDGKTIHIENEFSVGNTPVKSTQIRRFILTGKIDEANDFLGYRYFVSGPVEKGLGNGHKLGFPTANISYSDAKLLPSDGVYKGIVTICGCDYPALVNIGKNPTFSAEKRTVEVHIPNFDEDIYGKEIKAEFLGKIRDEIRFGSPQELIEQIKKDISFVIKA